MYFPWVFFKKNADWQMFTTSFLDMFSEVLVCDTAYAYFQNVVLWLYCFTEVVTGWQWSKSAMKIHMHPSQGNTSHNISVCEYPAAWEGPGNSSPNVAGSKLASILMTVHLFPLIIPVFLFSILRRAINIHYDTYIGACNCTAVDRFGFGAWMGAAYLSSVMAAGLFYW